MYRRLFVIAICCCLNYATSTARREKYARSPIQDGTEDDDVPDECKGKNYCTIKPANYPEAEFNAMFKGMKLLPQPNLVSEAFGDRAGEPNIDDECDTEVTFEPLYKIKGERGKWQTVVQAPEANYIQKVRLETCVEEGSKCFTAIPLGPGVSTHCRQKYSVWQLLVSDRNNGTEKIKVELPICCSCHYKISYTK